MCFALCILSWPGGGGDVVRQSPLAAVSDDQS